MNKFCGIVGMLFVLTGCGSPQSTLADPAGSVTSSLEKDGQGQNAINFETGVVESGVLNTFTELSIDGNANFAATVGVKDLGFVSELGGITSRDPSNSVLSTPAVVGDGYLVTTVSGLLAGVYVENDLTDPTNGLVGKTLKWSLFLPAADGNNPLSGFWRGPITFNIVNGSDSTSNAASGQIGLYLIQAGSALAGTAVLSVPAGGGGICGDHLTGSSSVTGTVSASGFSITLANSPLIFSCGLTTANAPAPLTMTATGALGVGTIAGTMNMAADNGSGGITITGPLALIRQ
ncbi:MAG: hypothetical protein HY282_18755 [Nitrospirae bacterium]|nr:hypothetical protein [Candidatus Manganitrophaceae bacterium]